MKLIDFNEFKGFQEMKNKMGIPKDYEVTFEEKIIMNKTELSALDWKQLNEGRGLDIDLKDIKAAEDGTLEYKGAKIALYIRDQDIEREYKFHVAWCRTLENMDQNKRLDRYVASRKINGVFKVNNIDRSNNSVSEEDVEKKLNICRNCLNALNYKGYRDKMMGQKNEIYTRFSLEAFLEVYDTNFKKMPKTDHNTAPLNIYPDNWAEISLARREEKHWLCQECRKDFKDDKSNLHVHHIDGVKGNVDKRNLRVLCKSCHAKQPYHG